MHRVDRDVVGDSKALLLVAFGAFLGIVIAYIWPWKTTIVSGTKDWVDVATAVGTVGAVLVAVGMPLFMHRKERLTAQQRAGLAAAIMQERTERMRRDVENAVSLLVHISEEGLYEGWLGNVEGFLGVLKSHVPWSIEEISRLSDLPSDCAFNLARASGNFSEGVARFEGAMDLLRAGNERLVRKLVERVAVPLESAQIGFEKSLVHINAAVAREFQ